MFERKLAQSVQHDYLQAAENYRLLQESKAPKSFSHTVVTMALALPILVVAAFALFYLI